ncbi:MAG: ABC transporter permease [Clostridia bacterium]|nr:ABC transporter permease [Clostridia bacterium]
MNHLEKLKRGLSTVLSALISVAIGLAFGFIILFLLSLSTYASAGEPFTLKQVFDTAYNEGFLRLMKGCFYMVRRGLKTEISQAAPLIMTGLSVAFAFKTGLFNIGAAGQYTLGAFGALYCAIVLKLPWYLCLLASVLFGAVWGAIPGFFKAYFKINEVITSIMFNWIGLYAVNTLIYGGGTGAMYCAKTTKTWVIGSGVYEGTTIPNISVFLSEKPQGLGLYLKDTSIAIFFAIIIAIILYIIINKTTFGYEIRACGHSQTAAKYAGISEKRNIILSMAIAGGLAGFGAGLYYLSGVAEWQPLVSTSLPGFGFDGISVALLASSNPIGVIFSALFIAHIDVGGGYMNASFFPREIADIVSGIIIYLCAFMLLFKTAISKGISRVFGAKKELEGGK